MQYRLGKHGEKISLLGYGCMRFTRNGTKTELEKAEKEIMLAIKHGVNYFDTAYIYPGNEVALGQILAKNNVRKDIYIATKLPQYLIKSMKGIEKLFQEELERLHTDYIDFYLMHMITDIASWEKLVSLGILDWIAEKKELGQIKNLGFSFHGNTEMFLQILDAYDWDFCQIQYNYMDEHTQAGRKGLLAAAAKDIPVIIMEPLRGGKLVSLLPDNARMLISNHAKGYSAAEWAFRWLMEQPEVTCVLSGMNSTDMVEENIKIANAVSIGEFTNEDFDFISSIKSSINEKVKVGCTACGYCLPCPQGVDIPGTFRCYNEIYTDSRISATREYIQTTALRQIPSSASYCISCGKCTKHCPQSIDIPNELKRASKKLETPLYKIVRFVVQRFKLW
ncbi:MAG: aldo/keto reductase [Lachnospiraceae bacterium]